MEALVSQDVMSHALVVQVPVAWLNNVFDSEAGYLEVRRLARGMSTSEQELNPFKRSLKDYNFKTEYDNTNFGYRTSWAGYLPRPGLSHHD